jgi:hypothetical protein
VATGPGAVRAVPVRVLTVLLPSCSGGSGHPPSSPTTADHTVATRGSTARAVDAGHAHAAAVYNAMWVDGSPRSDATSETYDGCCGMGESLHS